MTTRRPVAGHVSTTTTESDSRPFISPALPTGTTIQFAIFTWALKIIVAIGLWVQHFRRVVTSNTQPPDYTKKYLVRPALRNRVFLPRNHQKGQKLPLYLDIHGGGFVLWDPSTDDAFCRLFADRFGYCVVSIDYRKAPSYRFPTQTHDCAEVVRAVLADPDLPIDHDRVVLGGFSAGGNLSLGVAQFDDLRDKIKAVVPFYPVTELTGKYREYKDGQEDPSRKMFAWAYIPSGIDRRHPLLSCFYATREMLPQKMYFVGAEHDVLRKETEVMAKKLAGIKEDTDMGSEWNKNGIRWEMVPNSEHGFTHLQESDSKVDTERKRACDELYQRIDTWLKEEVFHK